jgi:hypothetical protein
MSPPVDPYAAPREASTATPAPDDVTELALTPAARIAAGLAFGTGGFALALALQTYLFFRHEPLLLSCVLLMVALAGALGFGAARLRRMRSAGAIVAIVAGALGLLLDATWTLVAMSSGLFSSLPLLLLPLLTLTTLFAALSVPATRRADAVRARLLRDGMVAGF